MAEGARLLSVCRLIPYRGFESHPLRHPNYFGRDKIMLKSSMDSKNVLRFFCLLLILFGAAISGCGEKSEKDLTSPDAPKISLTEGSGTETEAPQKAVPISEGSGSEVRDHPEVQQTEKLQREVKIPENVEGKWKAVQILIRNKTDEGKNELKTVPIGSSFQIGDTGIKVTAGPFFPNFVMDQGTYTSMNNQVINPAVQLVVEQNGKVLYKGWTFAKYPEMYSFEHDVFALELKDYIPEDVS